MSHFIESQSRLLEREVVSGEGRKECAQSLCQAGIPLCLDVKAGLRGHDGGMP